MCALQRRALVLPLGAAPLPVARLLLARLEAAAAATHLETLDLTEWGDQADEPTDTWRLKRIMSALPRNLRIAPYGTSTENGMYPFIGDDLRECARLAGREDLEVLKHNYNSRANDIEGLMERPMLWDWHEAIKPHCYA